MENILNFEDFSTNEKKKAAAKKEKFVPFWVKNAKDKDGKKGEEGKEGKKEEKGAKVEGAKGLSAKQKKLPPALQAAILKRMKK